MRAWQDRNGSLAGQKWELGRTEMRAWQMIICKTPHFASFPVIFVCFLPLLDGFCNILMFFFHFCLFFSHSPAIFAYWQDSLAEKLSTVTWQDRIEELAPPPDRKKWWQERIEFWQDGMVGPPLKMTQLRLCFQVGEGPSRGLLRDCTTSPINRFVALLDINCKRLILPFRRT